MNTVAKNRVSMIVVPIVLAVALGLGVPAPAHADAAPVFHGGPTVGVLCPGSTVLHPATFRCATPRPTCHKWRWWVIRHHVKHHYWACHEYPLPR